MGGDGRHASCKNKWKNLNILILILEDLGIRLIFAICILVRAALLNVLFQIPILTAIVMMETK
jgi:hypothetical protein